MRLTTAELGAMGLFATTVVVSPQLLGGVTSWSVCLIAGLCLLTLFAALRAVGRGAEWGGSVFWVAVAMSVALGWTLLQAIALPCAAVETVAPASVEQMRATLGIVGQDKAGWCALSRDRGNTELEVIKGTAILAVFLAGFLLSRSGRRDFLVQCVAASAVLLAAVSLGHRLLGAEKVFGLYDPVHADPKNGPLMNPNSLGGFLAMGFALLLALGAKSERAKRTFWLALALLVGGGVILALSVGGIAAMLGASVLFTALAARHRRGRGRARGLGSAIYVVVAVVVSASAGAYVVSERLVDELSSPNVSKIEMMGTTLRFALEQPLVGLGRGAFSASFVEQLGGKFRFVFPENLPAQWIAEWGLPVALMLMSVLALAMLDALREARTMTRIGALVAVVTITADNLLDFGLELSGVAVVASALLASGLVSSASSGLPRRSSSASGEEDGRTSWWKRALGWSRGTPRGFGTGAAVAGLVATAVLAPRVLATDLVSVQQRLVKASEAGDREAFRQELIRGLKAHPSEPALTLLAGAEAVHYGDPLALRWLNRTMQLAPEWEAPHLQAAQWLLRHRRFGQALLEIREAENRKPESAKRLLCQVLKAYPDASALFRAAPREDEPRFLEMAAACLDRRQELAVRIDERLLRLRPGLAEPRIRNAQRSIDKNDVAGAVNELRAVVERNPDHEQARLALARALIRAGEPETAVDCLRVAKESVSDTWNLVSLIAEAEAAAARPEAMRASLSELRGLSQGNPSRLSQAKQLEATLEERLGNRARALKALEDAFTFQPSDVTLERIARLAERIGFRKRAYIAYSDLCRNRPDNARWCQARDRLRGRESSAALRSIQSR